jgi:hypothetical protein
MITARVRASAMATLRVRTRARVKFWARDMI